MKSKILAQLPPLTNRVATEAVTDSYWRAAAKRARKYAGLLDEVINAQTRHRNTGSRRHKKKRV